jgi:hypothetical protein
MEIHSIRYCRAVCSVGNFTRAARRRKVAQPSLSNGIRKLERELGDALFVRNVDNIVLTFPGRAVRPHFEENNKRIEGIQEISSNLVPVSQPVTKRFAEQAFFSNYEHWASGGHGIFRSYYFRLVVRGWPRLFPHLRRHYFPIGTPKPPTACTAFRPIAVTAR